MSDSGRYDRPLMRDVARSLEEAAAALDEVGASAPIHIAAGPYTEAVAGLVKAVLASQAELVIRMQAASAAVERSEQQLADTEAVNTWNILRVEKRMDGE